MIKIFYHLNCIDGNASVWIMKSFLGDTPFEAHGIAFGYDYNSMVMNNIEQGDTVYFLDFSPPNLLIANILPLVEKIFIIDHHAAEGDFDDDKIISYIDETNCAAFNVFKYLYPNRDVPNILNFINITDLINTDAKHYYEIAAFVRTLEEEDFEKSLQDLERYKDISEEEAISIGREVFKQDYLKMEEELSEPLYNQIDILENTEVLFPVIKANIYDMGAEIDYKLKQLSEDPNPNGEIPYIACAYYEEDSFIRLNIRTNTMYIDASAVARHLGGKYGLTLGGGHRNAAVARFSPEQFEKLFQVEITI